MKNRLAKILSIFLKIISICLVVVVCTLFANDKPFSNDDVLLRVQELTNQDITLTLLDENMLRLENTIQDEGVSYAWIVSPNINGEFEQRKETMQRQSPYLELHFDDLSSVSFSAVAYYNNIKYTSAPFSVDDNGVLSQQKARQTSTQTINPITRNISDIVSLAYVAFLLVTVLAYYIVPKKYQWLVLLIASIVFYTLSGLHYILFILLSSYITFIIAKKINSNNIVYNKVMKDVIDNKEKKKLKTALAKANKRPLVLALIYTLGVMIVIKYTSFVFANINNVFSLNIDVVKLIMPLGLSFYTFTLIAYLLDVSRGKIIAEEKFTRFFLFISFFPHISQGPIARFSEVSPQLMHQIKFNMQNFKFASQRILWGFFIKLVLADRISIFISGVYNTHSEQSWIMLLIASLMYSIQVYADFYSSMEIALGSAELFGVKLKDNFLRPYFSKNMPEFWRRWHISLGEWFKDYLFYPISISKFNMKLSVKSRKKYGANFSRVASVFFPIMGVWIFTGLWHGSSWNFVLWGLFHGTMILMNTIFAQKLERFWGKIGVNINNFFFKLLQMSKVFFICTIGRIFFRSPDVETSFAIMKNIFTFSNPSATLFNTAGINFNLTEILNFSSAIIALILLLVVSILKENKIQLREVINNRFIVFRWIIWLVIIFMTVIFGVYGPGTIPTFIYEAF